MKNADMPAQPAGKVTTPVPKGGDPLGDYRKAANGLTKREELVFRMLPETYRQYCEGARAGDYPWQPDWPTGVAIEATRLADAALAVLENQEQERVDGIGKR